MTTQRITGAWLTFFTVCVVLNHAIQGQLSFLDAVYVVFCIPLMVSIFVDTSLARFGQVAVIIVTGVIMVLDGDYSRPFGFIIMVIGQLYVYRYGFLDKYLFPKVIFTSIVYAVLFLVTLSNPGNAVLWLFMAATCQGGVWLPVWDMIKERQKDLEKKLATSETLLKESVEAGMVLVDEIRSKESKNGCK